MEALAIILVFAGAIALSFGLVAAVTGWGILPVVEAFGGPELPFWPVFILVWVLLTLTTQKQINNNVKKKENA